MGVGFDGTLLKAAPRTETQPAPAPSAHRERHASLVIQTSFLGDMVLTTPLIAELARRGPVDVVATPAAAPLLTNNPSVRDVIPYDKRGDASGLFGLYRTSRALRARQEADRSDAPAAQVAYLAQGSVRSALLAVVAGIPERVGFSTSPGRPLYTRCVVYRDDKHHAERLWRLAAKGPDEAPDASQLRPRLFPGDEDVGAVDSLLRHAGYRNEPLIVLAPGSIWGTKRWPYYPELARRIASRARVAIIGGSGDRELATAILAAPGTTAIDATGTLSLLASAELIGRARALVTNDSAPQHLASAMSTPTITLFGPTVSSFGFGPLAPGSVSAGHDTLACRPCHKHGPQRCPLGHWRCMRELSVAEVDALVLRVAG